MLQSEINQLSTTQAESMREFLLLCEYLDTRPSQNSNLKGNINPNKVAGDVPLDKKLVKPLWYIERETLVTILQVIKSLDEDLKRKIVSIITLRNKKEEERQELIYNSYSFHNNMMDTSDYYFSE